MPDQDSNLPASGQNPVPQVLPESRSIPVVEEVFQAPIQIQSPVPLPAVPPAPDQPPAEQKKFNFPPLKYLLLGLGALAVLGGIAFALNSFFFSAKSPEQTTLTYWGLEEKTVMDSLIREYYLRRTLQKKYPKIPVNVAMAARVIVIVITNSI